MLMRAVLVLLATALDRCEPWSSRLRCSVARREEKRPSGAVCISLKILFQKGITFQTRQYCTMCKKFRRSQYLLIKNRRNAISKIAYVPLTFVSGTDRCSPSPGAVPRTKQQCQVRQGALCTLRPGPRALRGLPSVIFSLDFSKSEIERFVF